MAMEIALLPFAELATKEYLAIFASLVDEVLENSSDVIQGFRNVAKRKHGHTISFDKA